jgi:ribulose 1,5-bisphosphate synthetase/thiazole synthase
LNRHISKITFAVLALLIDFSVLSDMTAGISLTIVIVGAGMGGLGAAISLRKAGHKVIVLEQAPDFSEASYQSGCAIRASSFTPKDPCDAQRGIVAKL